MISIIIPYLNQPEHLGNCLRSLQDQRFSLEKVEIIVVDNGSKELPTYICESCGLSVQLVGEDTPGPGPARNKGISVSKAPILAFIDADCIADANWLQSISKAFENPATQIIGGDVRIAIANPNRVTMLEAYESVYAYRQKMYIEHQGFSGTGNLAMRREVHAQVGPFAGIGVAEDRDWGQRATRKGFKIVYRPEMKVFHPARQSLSELYTKWDRHIAHDYAERTLSTKARLVWFGKAVALAASPVWEVPRILKSDRINTFTERMMALRILFSIRQFRAMKMLKMLTKVRAAPANIKWNSGRRR